MNHKKLPPAPEITGSVLPEEDSLTQPIAKPNVSVGISSFSVQSQRLLDSVKQLPKVTKDDFEKVRSYR